MTSHFKSTVSAIAALAFAATASAQGGGGGIAMSVAGVKFPGTVYQNSDQIPGASGTMHLNQTGAGQPKLHMTFRGLLPNKAYKVYLDRNGTTAATPHNFGPWIQVGQFTSNATGNGVFQFQASAGSVAKGNHTWSVFVNRADVGKTVLISDNFSFTIP